MKCLRQYCVCTCMYVAETFSIPAIRISSSNKYIYPHYERFEQNWHSKTQQSLALVFGYLVSGAIYFHMKLLKIDAKNLFFNQSYAQESWIRQTWQSNQRLNDKHSQINFQYQSIKRWWHSNSLFQQLPNFLHFYSAQSSFACLYCNAKHVKTNKK